MADDPRRTLTEEEQAQVAREMDKWRGDIVARMFSGPAPTEAQIQAGIDAAMRATVAQPYRQLPPSETVTVANAPRVVDADDPTGSKARSGWRDEKPNWTPNKFESELVDRMVDKFCGPPNGPVKE
jgi:hypothetical protein